MRRWLGECRVPIWSPKPKNRSDCPLRCPWSALALDSRMPSYANRSSPEEIAQVQNLFKWWKWLRCCVDLTLMEMKAPAQYKQSGNNCRPNDDTHDWPLTRYCYYLSSAACFDRYLVTYLPQRETRYMTRRISGGDSNFPNWVWCIPLEGRPKITSYAIPCYASSAGAASITGPSPISFNCSRSK